MSDIKCDPTKESRQSPVPHDYEVTGVVEGSFATGGDYDVLKCRNCGRIAYSQLPN